MTTTKIFSFGVFTLFPTWPLPKAIIDSFTTQRARLTPCPLRECKHPEGNFQRLFLFTYLQSREQGCHIAHLGSMNHPLVISKQKQFIDFFTVHRAILTPDQMRKCNHPDVISIIQLVMHLFPIGDAPIFVVYMYRNPILLREEIQSQWMNKF